MKKCHMNLGLVAAVLVGFSNGIVSAGHGPHPAGHCSSPLGVPCAPKRDSFGYFKTTWRRWPTQQPEAVAPREPETLPAPAEQPSPAIVPESPGTPPSGPGPATPSPTVPGGQGPQSPLVPPFDEGTGKPPFEAAPLPSPFDVPPGLPDAAAFPSPPPADAPPSNESSRPPEKQPAADADLPPTMPNDDPFKDEPESEVGPAPGAAPKSSSNTPDKLDGVLRQAAAKSGLLDGAPPELDSLLGAPPSHDVVEPRRLERDAEDVPAEALPGPSLRANPLRSANQGGRRKTIVSTASFSSPQGAAVGGEGSVWRRNPLRSN